jgi:hypothetical protein
VEGSTGNARWVFAVATLAKNAQAAKGLLRHTSLAIPLGHYVKIVPEVTERAMHQVEQLFSTDDNTPSQ